MNTKYDIIIIGGGASGLCAGIEAARRFKQAGKKGKLLIAERLPRVGKKLLVTGNGRCNLTNMNISPENYSSGFDFAAKVLERFTPKSNLDFFKSIGLYTVQEDEGRVYPMSLQATSVLDALRLELSRLGVESLCSQEISELKQRDGRYILNGSISAGSVIVAAGGCAAEVHGSNGSGFKLLENLGHKIEAPYPALTKLLSKNKFLPSLQGLRLRARLSLYINDRQISREEGELQFTGSGLSGIALMQLSSAVSKELSRSGKAKVKIVTDSAPLIEKDELYSYLTDRIHSMPDIEAANILAGILPKRLSEVIVKMTGGSLSAPMRSLNAKKIAELTKAIPFEINGSAGFKEAQVSGGGASTGEFDANSLQSKLHKGLFACGEVLDVTGKCGGYNLQWAWSSGRAAAISAAEISLNR